MQMARPNRVSLLNAILTTFLGAPRRKTSQSSTSPVMPKIVMEGFNMTMIRRAKLHNIKHGRKNGQARKR